MSSLLPMNTLMIGQLMPKDWIKEDKLKEKDIFAGELRKEDMVWPSTWKWDYEKYISTTAWKLAR